MFSLITTEVQARDDWQAGVCVVLERSVCCVGSFGRESDDGYSVENGLDISRPRKKRESDIQREEKRGFGLLTVTNI